MKDKSNKKALENKKIEEYYYLQKTLEICNIETSDIHSSESPDFEISVQGKKIGIEITEYHSDASKRGSELRKTEKYDNVIENEINKQVRQHDDLKGILCAYVFQNNKRPEKRKELPQFAREFIECVRKAISNGSFENITKDFNTIENFNSFPLVKNYLQYIVQDKLEGRRYEHLHDKFLTWTQPWEVGTLDVMEKNLINVIKPKIGKVKNYLNKSLDEIWLIVGFRVSPSQLVLLIGSVDDKLQIRSVDDELHNFKELENILKESGFNKIYLCFYGEEIVYEWPRWKKYPQTKKGPHKQKGSIS